MISQSRRRGFTVIELLVVIAIIGMLVALLMPAVQAARESARRSTCQNHLRQLGVALHNYHDAHSILPPGSIFRYVSTPLNGWGWGAMILPFVDQSPLFNSLDFESGTIAGSNIAAIDEVVPVWRCPSDTAPPRALLNIPDSAQATVAIGNYCGSDGMLGQLSEIRFSRVTDGLSQTLMLGERVYQPGSAGFDDRFTSSWCGMLSTGADFVHGSVPHLGASSGISINFSLTSPGAFTSRHAGGAFFAMGDGAVRFLSENINGELFEAMGTIAGGEVVTLP